MAEEYLDSRMIDNYAGGLENFDVDFTNATDIV